MKLYTKKQLYIDETQSNFSYYKEFENGLVLKAEIICYYGEYTQYQENLIKEAFEELELEAQNAKFSVIKFKSYFELAIQELNSKLAVFAEKLRLFQKIEIRGFIEFFLDNYYVCSVIGNGSLIIFRKGSLYYSLHNDATNNKKIDLFAELVEGDLNNGDEIIYFANNISYFTDAEDFAYIGEINGTDERTIVQIIEDMLNERTSLDSIGMIHLDFIKLDDQSINIGSGNSVSDYVDRFQYFFKRRRYAMSLIGFGALMCLLVGLLLSNFFTSSNGIRISTTDTNSEEYFSLASIKKEIEDFKILDPTSTEKYTIYKKLENKINQLEKEGKLPLDIKQLKNMLQAEYQAGFNIETIEQLDDWTITFNSSDTLDIGKPKALFASNQLSIIGDQGVIIGATSNENRGITQKLGLESRIEGCTPNLQNNGLLCFDNGNRIYNLTKQNIQTASIWGAGSSGEFEKQITQIGTFGSSNMYLLVNNKSLNSAGTYILRYPLIPGTRESFKEPLNYSFANGFNPGSISSMSIDGSFLIWAPGDQSLYQMRRDGTASQNRKIPLEGGQDLYTTDPVATGSKALPTTTPTGVKVISYASSNYVYLYQPTKRVLLIYKSAPNKTSEGSKYNYSLKYLFAIQLPKAEILDVAVSDSSKPQLSILTNQGVANIKLYDYIESYESTLASNQQAANR